MSAALTVERPDEIPILQIDNVSIAYRSGVVLTPVISQISFDVPKGKTVALVGESGSGKTTLAQAVIGLLPSAARITDGKILFRDSGRSGAAAKEPLDIASLNSNATRLRNLRGGRIGMIFQEPSAALSPVYTIGNLLIESLQAHESVSTIQARERAKDILARVGFDHPVAALDKYPFELSGGLRQRAMIAAALICNPALLIADEPTSALDVTVQALLLKLLSDLQATMGMSVLLITHDLGVTATIADEIVVLYRGEVMERGTARDLLKNPQHPYLKALMLAGPTMAGTQSSRLTPLRPIAPPTEAFQQRWTRTHDANRGAPLVELTNLVKRYPGRARGFSAPDAGTSTLALNDVSLTIRQGECLGLVGESGCGKSTLCRILMQILKPDAGQILIHQEGALQSAASLNEAQVKQLRQRIQYVFQDPFGSLNPRHTIREVLTEPFEIHGLGEHNQRNEWAIELLSLVGLNANMLDRFPNAFSGGQRQRIAIARALALKPELLVCDEPVSALDVSIQAQILNLLQDLKQSLGLTYLFVSHNLAVIRHLADRVAVMCRGRIVEVAPTASLFATPHHPYTKALMAAAPDTDPDRKLDLSGLMDGRASDPAAWDPPFRLLGDSKARYERVADDHFVAIA